MVQTAPLCYQARVVEEKELPLFVLSLPNEACDYDELLEEVLQVIDRGTNRAQEKYRLLVFCAAGRCRPSWPWLIAAFSRLDKRYKKALQKLYLVHEKSWVRVCMQLLENVVSPKFGRKVKHVKSLARLATLLGKTMDHIDVPTEVNEYDERVTNDDCEPPPPPPPAMDKGALQRMKEKRRHSPPSVPAPRIAARPLQTPTRACREDMAQAVLPVVPPRRNTSSRPRETGTRDCIIFEDPVEEDEEESAANLAASKLEALLAPDMTTHKTTQRSTSAPTVLRHERVKRTHAARESQKKSSGPAPLRRAISGPLTPSSAVKQNFIPRNHGMPPPKIKIHGREVRIKTRKAGTGDLEGKVGGLAALFEERALIAESMS